FNGFGTAANPTLSGTFTLTSGNGGTTFLRPEDGAWDPRSPHDYYFVTTDQLDTVQDGLGDQVGHNRLWHMHYNDINNPTAGGTIAAVLDGTEGGNMFDNITIDKSGHILLQEDIGNAAHNGKIWLYDINGSAHNLTLIAEHDPARFGNVGLAATAPFTQD